MKKWTHGMGIGMTFVMLSLSACSSIGKVVSALPGTGDSFNLGASFNPTVAQMTEALKEALSYGAEDAGAELSFPGAFTKNLARQIPLPPEAKPILDNISQIPGGQEKVDDLIFRINSAAEMAAGKVGPIFVDAITSMTFSDAEGILRGSSNAATEYLRRTTTAALKDAFRPKLEAALDEPIFGGSSTISAETAWDTLVSAYNKIANSIIGRLGNLTPVNTSLSDFVLDKAINAVFTQMEIMEGNIRLDPIQYLSDMAAKVFDWVSK